MDSFQLNKILISKFPNLEQAYKEEVSWQEGDDTGSHVVYEDVFVPYLRECILKKDLNEIRKITGFLENLLDLNDDYVSEVVSLSVIESIMDLFDLNEDLIIVFGKKSKEIISELMQFY